MSATPVGAGWRVGVRGRVPAVLAGIGGCLFLVAATSGQDVLPSFVETPGQHYYHGIGWLYPAVQVAATVAALCLPRWWPYLLASAGSLALPAALEGVTLAEYPVGLNIVFEAAYPLAILGVLTSAQGLSRRAAGWGPAVAGLAIGARLFGSVMLGPRLAQTKYVGGVRRVLFLADAWHLGLICLGLLTIIPAMWRYRRGDPDAAGWTAGRGEAAGSGEATGWSPTRIRLVIVAGLATSLAAPLSLLTTQRLAGLLGVTYSALYRHQYAEIAVLGAITLVVVGILTAVAGLWPLAGALTAALVQVAVVAPAILSLWALGYSQPAVRWAGGLAGAALGAVAAGSRWRVAAAGSLSVLAATALFIAYGATTGHPEKLAEQYRVVPAVLIFALITAAATAVVGATAPVLAPRGALPAVVGPLAGLLATGGLQTIQVTYLHDGLPTSSVLNPVYHLTTSAVLLLVAGAAVGGLGLARLLAARRAERRHTEQIRREAAAAERDRLARPIHDGVLQVLALVQRHGAEQGGDNDRLAALAALAGEQEVALRSLLAGDAAGPPGDGGRADTRGPTEPDEDLRTPLLALASPRIEIAGPAEPVLLPAGTVAELAAAVRAALDNVRRHAGPDARAWVLMEDEPEPAGVRVTVRDDGVGFQPGRLAEAAEAGRLGVAQSMRGRVDDLGGTTEIRSVPGEGTEVEFWIPRSPAHQRR